MSRYESCFSRLKGEQRGALVPFVVLGDPSIDASLEIIDTLIAAGADALELGLPFSDPLADGPTIQGAMSRALAAGVTPEDCFGMLRTVRKRHESIPIGLLVYANLACAMGLDEFYGRCAAAGVDSVLVADVPVAEAAPFRDAALKNDIDPVLLCPPNIDEVALEQVARLGRGYTYLLSRPGVTGTQTAAGQPVDLLLKRLRDLKAPPPILGFGISGPEQVKSALRTGAAGVISGSAIIEHIEQSPDDLPAIKQRLHTFVAALKAATLLASTDPPLPP